MNTAEHRGRIDHAGCLYAPAFELRLLGSVGLGSAWLIAVAWLAAPHRLVLLGLAIVCLGGAGGFLLRRRRSAAVCAVGAGSARAAITAVIVGELALGVALTVLGILYA